MKKIMCLNLLVLFMVTGYKQLLAQSWQPVGRTGFSAGQAWYTSIAIDKNNVPYVVYQDRGNAAKATVMKLANNAWVKVGNEGFSADPVGYTHIVVDANIVPYVIYEDFANGVNTVVVKKFNGTTWQQVGASQPCDVAATPTIAICPTGEFYIAFYHGEVKVMKLSGSSWEAVGNASFAKGGSNGSSASPSLTVDQNGVPFVIYSSQNGVKVIKYSGVSWTTVGNLGNLTVTMYSTIKVDNNNVPFIAVWTGSKLVIEKLINGNWAVVGTNNIPVAYIPWTSMVVHNGEPYVLTTVSVPQSNYTTVQAMVSVLKNNSWVTLSSSTAVSSSGAYFGEIAFNSALKPYVIYQDYGNGQKATVMAY